MQWIYTCNVDYSLKYKSYHCRSLLIIIILLLLLTAPHNADCTRHLLKPDPRVFHTFKRSCFIPIMSLVTCGCGHGTVIRGYAIQSLFHNQSNLNFAMEKLILLLGIKFYQSIGTKNELIAARQPKNIQLSQSQVRSMVHSSLTCSLLLFVILLFARGTPSV